MHLPLFVRSPRGCGTWAWKRRVDVGLILAVLPLLLTLVALVSLWVRCASSGNVLFRQQRIGKHGKPFTMYKFRSMKEGASSECHLEHVRGIARSGAPMTKLDVIGDERLIPGGRLMRLVALDELPQIINVIRGEMSLVGPRPCLPEEFAYFTEEQKQRFNVPPGLTGLWQVGGKNLTTFSEMGEMDRFYSGHASLWMDLTIIARTPGAILLQAHRQTFRRNAALKAPVSGDEGNSPARISLEKS